MSPISNVNFKRVMKIVSVATVMWLWVVAPPLYGCNTPVFRYAIENWPPDPYGLLVFHRDALPDSDKAIIDALRKQITDERSPANLAIRLVNLDTSVPEPIREIWKNSGQGDLPRAVVCYPETSGLQGIAWSGRLTSAAADLLLDSPKRREIAQRLIKGDAIVWLLLESGDRAKDDSAATSLTAQLAQIKEEIGPMYAEQFGQTNDSSGTTYLRGPAFRFGDASPPPLSFSVVRMSPSDLAEQAFVDSLLRMDPDVAKCVGEPIAFPIFGRGRLLCAIVGDDIDSGLVRSACEFLSDACSCQVKSLNPGFDLLMTANWDAALVNLLTPDQPPAVLTGVMPERLDAPWTTQSATVANTSLTVGASADVVPVHRLLRTTMIALAAVLAAVVVSTLVLWSFVLRRATARQSRKRL